MYLGGMAAYDGSCMWMEYGAVIRPIMRAMLGTHRYEYHVIYCVLLRFVKATRR